MIDPLMVLACLLALVLAAVSLWLSRHPWPKILEPREDETDEERVERHSW
jgi:hypothetical protein